MMFKRKISTYEAKQALRDKAMRRALLEFLQDATPERGSKDPEKPHLIPPRWPKPMRDDEDVEEELKRILGN